MQYKVLIFVITGCQVVMAVYFRMRGGGMYLNAVIYSAYWLEEDVNIGV